MYELDTQLDENAEELQVKAQCWAEIEAILTKYDCSLTGEGTYFDEYGNDYNTCSAKNFSVVSNVYPKRINQYLDNCGKQQKDQAILDAKNKYKELKANYSKYKDLKPIKIGKTTVSSFWFENLYINKKLVALPLFNWNPNKYWARSIKSSNHHSVYLDVDEYSDYFGYNGEPHFTTMYWKIEIEGGYRKNQFTEWFKFRKNVPAENYQDMIDVCKLIDELVEAGVLYFMGTNNE